MKIGSRHRMILIIFWQHLQKPINQRQLLNLKRKTLVSVDCPWKWSQNKVVKEYSKFLFIYFLFNQIVYLFFNQIIYIVLHQIIYILFNRIVYIFLKSFTHLAIFSFFFISHHSYRKFTRGKDVNKYSAKDLANIFGKTELTDEPVKKRIKIEEIKKTEEIIGPIGEADTTAGVLTYKGGNMSDYFKNKMPTMSLITKNKNNERDDGSDDDESVRYVGFGFSSDTKKTSDSNAYAFDNPALDTNDNNNKNKSEFCFDNPALDYQNSKTIDNKNLTSTTKISKFKKINFTKSESDLNNVVECIPKENNENTIDKKIKKKKNKKNKEVEGFVNDALDLDVKIENSGNIDGDDFEVSRSDFGLSNDALDITDEINGKKRVTFNDKIQYNTDLSKKKKSKNKLDKFEVDNEKLKKKEEKKKKKKKEKDILSVEENNVFVNEALDVEIINEEINDNEANEKKSKKSKRKRSRRISNLETIEEAPEEEKEVSTLDSNDINEPPKKKKKKNKDVVNESIEIIHVEDLADKEKKDDDDVEEVEVVCIAEGTKKKKGKIKKKNNKISADDDEVVEIETPEEIIIDDENSNKENHEDVIDDGENEKKKSKKNKRNKKANDLVIEQVEDNEEEKVSNVGEDKKLLDVKKTVKNSTASPAASAAGDKASKAKKKIKSFFFTKSLQNPVLNFSGSNINEIKGYGVKG